MENDQNLYIEVIPGRLLWASLPKAPKRTPKVHFFNVDKDFIYEPFFADFGPLSLGSIWRYCRMLHSMLSDPALADTILVHHCSTDPKMRANAALLACTYRVIVLKQPAAAAFEPFAEISAPFLAYRDASCGVCRYQCTIMDCLHGIEQAIKLGWFDWTAFDVESYEYFSRVENGDMNWIIPQKFLAFTGPFPTSTDADGWRAFTPEDYVSTFRNSGIGLVVRLNRAQYDRRRFIDSGIRHVDLYFRDGSCPSQEIIDKFLHIAELEECPIAVHCKAGLGRTGTLIGLYAMKHFGFPARAFIAWNRICRPGSILGPQQDFLLAMQQSMWAAGGFLPPPSGMNALISGMEQLKMRERPENLSLSRQQRNELEAYEDKGQGDRLCNAKKDASAHARREALEKRG